MRRVYTIESMPEDVLMGILRVLKRITGNVERETPRLDTGSGLYRGLSELARTEPVRTQLRYAILQEGKRLFPEIEDLPERLQEKIGKRALEWHLEGLSGKQIEYEVRELFPKLSPERIQLIAQTEASTASTLFTRVRAESEGFNWYEWMGALDARERQSHRHMEGVLVRWSDPPAPELLIGEESQGHYHAGQTFNCRCIPSVIPSPDDIRGWPRKVYWQGQIHRMLRREFLLLPQ